MLIETDNYTTPGGAAEMLGCSTQNIIDLCNRGSLPCVRLEHGWRLISRPAIREYAALRYGRLLARAEALATAAANK